MGPADQPPPHSDPDTEANPALDRLDPGTEAGPDGHPPAHGRRGRADKEAVRRVILDAARELFACEGYGNVSLRKIARRIGYTPMALYVHFRDKSEILDCICDETFAAFRANAERLDQLDLPPRERLAAGLRAYVEFGLAHPHHYQLTFMTPPCGGEGLGRRSDIGRECFQRMRCRVSLCIAGSRDVESPEVELASQTMWTAVHGLVSLLIARPAFPWLDRELLIESVIAGTLRGLE
jgi:AcrR family transcriptional regulator